MMSAMAPRIPPLPLEERDPRTEEMLVGVCGRPTAPSSTSSATLARHPKLFKRWSAFGGTLLYGGALRPASASS